MGFVCRKVILPFVSPVPNLTLADISFPLHLIPLVIRSAFLIVTEFYTYVVKTSDILSGNAVFAKIPFPEPDGQNREI